MPIPPDSPPASILAIHVSRIGDTMLLTPSVRALARHWPQARIDFAGSRRSAEVFENLPFVDSVRVLNKKWVALQGRLPGQPYDLAIVWGNDGDVPFVEYALRVARRVVAFEQPRDDLNRRLDVVVPRPAFQSRNAVDYLLAMLEPLGIPPDGHALSYAVSANERAWAGDYLRNHLPAGAWPLIGLQIASFPTKGYRDWPVEHFATLCRRLQSEHPGAHFLIFGGPLERDRTQALKATLGTAATHLAGELSLRQTAALMARIDLYIGVDTGPTHIMGALHKPMVAMYHPSSPSTLLAPLDHPCLWTIDHPAAGQGFNIDIPMAEVGVDTVWTAVRDALATLHRDDPDTDPDPGQSA